MKTKLLLILALGISVAEAQVPPPVEASAAQVAAGTVGAPYYVSPRRLAGGGGPVVASSVTDTGLTAGRVTFAGTGGLLSDDADLTFATDTLTFTKGMTTLLGVAASAITPVTELEVDSTSTSSPRGIMTAQFNTGTDGARFHMRKARGTRATPLVVVTGDNLGRIVGSGYDGANYLEMAGIIFGTEGTIAATRVPTTITFQTATNALPSVLTTAMTINSSQAVTFAAATNHTGNADFTGTVFANSISAHSGTPDSVKFPTRIQVADSARNQTSASMLTTGAYLFVSNPTVTDSSTAGSGTAASAVFSSFAAPTLAASNTSVTTTTAATVYIAGPPVAGTNQTITAAYSEWIAAGNVRWGGYGAGALTTDANGVITAASDGRMKTVVRPFARGLAEVRQLSPQVYRWKGGFGLDTEHDYSGFVAQDVQRVIPEAIGRRPDGMLTFNDRPVLAAVVNAVNELDARVISRVEIRVFEAIALLAFILGIRANLKKA